MKRTASLALSLTMSLVLASSSDAATMVITGVTTTPSFTAPLTTSVDLTSFTDGSGTYSDLTFSTVNNSTGSPIVHATGTAVPASANAALSGAGLDTGTLSTGAGSLFEVTPSSASDKLFIIFDSTTSPTFYQGPGAVTARDSNGDPIGSVVTVNDDSDGASGMNDVVVLGDQFTTATLDRNGANPLDRILLGVSIDVADFGVSDLSTIAGFTIAGELHNAGTGMGNASLDSLDVHVVGVAAIPEPASLALLAFGAVAAAVRGRRV